jgi:hypothetical protein
MEDGNARCFLNTTSFSNDGDKLGEYSIINNRTYTDFTMTVKAKTAESIVSNTYADYAVIFGWQDSENYYYLMANADTASSQLFVVKSGVRTVLGTSSTALIPDTAWHTIEVSRTGDSITVKLDGVIKIGPVSDSTYSQGGAGIGSYNDSVYFDDVGVIDSSIDDTIPPTDIREVRDGTGQDMDSTYSTSQLSANWTASSDPESGILAYWYAIGDTPGSTGVVSWTYTSDGTVTGVTESGLSLSVGVTYYFTVKAENGIGLQSNPTNSDGQCVLGGGTGDGPPKTPRNEIDVKTYPNPYNPSRGSSMKFSVSGTDGGEVRIYTISGKLVKELVIQSGESEVNWDVVNEDGNKIKSGIYVYVIANTEGNKKIGKVVISN